MMSHSSAFGLPILPLLLILCIGYRIRVVASPKRIIYFLIQWRARGEGPAGVVNQLGLAYVCVRLEAPSLV